MQICFKNITVLVFGSLISGDYTFAQKTPARPDSIYLYENIEAYSKRSKFNTFMYRLIFKPVVPTPVKKGVKKKTKKKLIQKPYSSYEGKIIRNINIETLDPFRHSISGASVVPQNLLTRTGNKLHIKSQQITIRNLLLIRQNQPFDSLLVKESERLIRSRGYVHDVSFFITATSKNSDSVDIFIRELDNWSIIPKASFSNTNASVQLLDKNFLGTGHTLKSDYTRYPATNDNAFNSYYYIPNIRNTYINSTLLYYTDQFGSYTKSFAVDRPFFSPLAKLAGGINFSQQFQQDYFQVNDSLIILQPFKYNVQDFWAGHSVQLFKGNTENKRTTNFISAVRYYRIQYLEKPAEIFDMLHRFSNEDFYLASIGISTRKYLQDKYVFRFGLTEDIPIGKVFGLTGGYQIKDFSKRLYLGMRVSFGNYYDWGYLSSNYEFGTFFHGSQSEQGVFAAGVNYFTRIIVIGKWKIRQFIKPQVTIGINRFSYDTLTLNDGYGLDGYKSSTLSGNSRLLFTMQTQSYAPWDFFGFRFGPYIICSLGTLGDATTGFKNSKLYSQIGLGVIIKNEYLVFNTIQFSISFYPNIPGSGQDLFKINSFKTTDFGFRNFEIGKPAPVIFQ